MTETPSHAELVAAITYYRRSVPDDRRTCKRGPDCDLCRANETGRILADTLTDILRRHKPLRFVHHPEIGEDDEGDPIYGEPVYEKGSACCNCVTQSWPCADVATVTTALQKMGAL